VRAAALVIAAAAVLSALTVLGLHWAVAKPAPASPGSILGFVKLDRAAPDLSLPSLRGSGTITVTKLAGKPIVLNFWASTCVDCRKETPALAQVARSLGSKVSFLGVDSVDLHSRAVAFESKYQVPYPSLFDPKGTGAAKYDVPALPVTFFLSRSGTKILGENIGALTPKSLMTILHNLYGTT
jgi:cytochrome c biogenesis protein CcmG, thiol:disulfide interchange protein DsbE